MLEALPLRGPGHRRKPLQPLHDGSAARRLGDLNPGATPLALI